MQINRNCLKAIAPSLCDPVSLFYVASSCRLSYSKYVGTEMKIIYMCVRYVGTEMKITGVGGTPSMIKISIHDLLFMCFQK